jgi:hypothetical protein
VELVTRCSIGTVASDVVRPAVNAKPASNGAVKPGAWNGLLWWNVTVAASSAKLTVTMLVEISAELHCTDWNVLCTSRVGFRRSPKV